MQFIQRYEHFGISGNRQRPYRIVLRFARGTVPPGLDANIYWGNNPTPVTALKPAITPVQGRNDIVIFELSAAQMQQASTYSGQLYVELSYDGMVQARGQVISDNQTAVQAPDEMITFKTVTGQSIYVFVDEVLAQMLQMQNDVAEKHGQVNEAKEHIDETSDHVDEKSDHIDQQVIEAGQILLAIQQLSVLLNQLGIDVQQLRNAVAEDAESAASSEAAANSSAGTSANILATINIILTSIQAAQSEIEAKRLQVSQNAAIVAQDSEDVNNDAIFVNQQRVIVEQVKAAIDLIKSAIDTTKGEIDGINTALLAARDTAVTARNDAIAAQGTAIIAMNDATTAKNDAVTAKTDALQAKADALAAKADTLQAKADTLQAKADTLTARDAAIAAATNYVVRPGSNVNTAYTINLAAKDNQFHYLNLNGNITFTITGIADGRAAWVRLVQTGAGGFVPTFPASVKFPGGALPDVNLTAGGVTVITLVGNSDGTIDGAYSKQ